MFFIVSCQDVIKTGSSAPYKEIAGFIAVINKAGLHGKKRKANVCLIHPQRNKPGEGNISSFHCCPFKGESAFLICAFVFVCFFFIRQSHIKFPLCTLLDILEYFQVDGSATSVPLLKVLCCPCMCMYHISPHNTSTLLCEV